MKNFLDTKGYHRKLTSRLPSPNPKGILTDIRLHLSIKPSQAEHIFVMGPPRSGTTLIRGIISAHSKITTTDSETFFFNRRRVSLFQSPEVKNYHEILKKSRSKLEVFDEIASIFRERDGASYFLEKSPEHALVLSNLLQWYPKSKFVFVLRDGRDAYASTLRNPELNKLGGNYPKMWRDIAKECLKNLDHPSLLLMHYESFVKAPEEKAAELMRFFELDLEPYQLNPEAFSNTSMAKQAGHELLSSPITTSSIGSYRTKLSKKQLVEFKNIAGSELQRLGCS